jgi:hypothetical protein
MGIQDRDYMKRSSGGSAGPPSSLDEKVEALLGGFVKRHKRLLKVGGIVLLVLIVAGVLLAMLAG